jgi:hypothetical protein
MFIGLYFVLRGTDSSWKFPEIALIGAVSGISTSELRLYDDCAALDISDCLVTGSFDIGG